MFDQLKSAVVLLRLRLDDETHFRDPDGTYDPDYIDDLKCQARSLARLAERLQSHNEAARSGRNKRATA